MSYDHTKNPPNRPLVALSAGAITKSDTEDLTMYVVPYCVVAGTIKFLPVNNADNDPVSMDVLAGWQCPWLVRRVFSTGTAGTFRSLDKIY